MIHEQLVKNKHFMRGIEVLYKHKHQEKIFIKFAEELAELSANLLKKVNKPNSVTPYDIAEELVDVQQHIILAEKYFDEDFLSNIAEEKSHKMLQSDDYKIYEAKEELCQ